MGQKVNPHGLRVGVIKNWDSRWFEKDETFGETLVSDYNLREYLKSTLQQAGVPKIEIERSGDKVKVYIHCAKPGMVIGRGGSEIGKLKSDIESKLGAGKTVSVNVVEIRQPDLNAQLVAESISGQLERRVTFRRAMKQAISRTMHAGAKGIKVQCSGRLGGAEIARTEHYHEGTIPLQTLRADIDYGFWEANTTYGKIGVKVWIFKGEVLPDVKKKFATIQPDLNPPRPERRNGDRRNSNGYRGDRRDGKNGGGRRDGNRDGRNGGNNGGQRPYRNAAKEGGNK